MGLPLRLGVERDLAAVAPPGLVELHRALVRQVMHSGGGKGTLISPRTSRGPTRFFAIEALLASRAKNWMDADPGGAPHL
jgi:hypothetical protein